jgi:hypothetical protein
LEAILRKPSDKQSGQELAFLPVASIPEVVLSPSLGNRQLAP